MIDRAASWFAASRARQWAVALITLPPLLYAALALGRLAGSWSAQPLG
ncbi:hypothetical protein [Novosphingopyxis baekryungensis]|nr:hypothetical protein [Novosphingopyxis baekryungensis]